MQELLACESLFSDKYKRHKNTERSINSSTGSYFRQLKVTDNPKIVAEIEKAVEQDTKLAFNTVQRFNVNEETIILNIQNSEYIINIGFNKYSDSNAKIFVEAPPAAFGK